MYKDDITRAEIEAIVRQRYTIVSTGASTKVRNVEKALVANKPVRRICKQKGSDKGVAGKGVSSVVAVAKNDKSNAKEGGSTTTCVTSVTDAWSQAIVGSTAPRTSSPPRISRKKAPVRL